MAPKIAESVSHLNLRKAKPVRLFEQAVEQIWALIHAGSLRPGDKLPSENALSKILDVSRSSVREALRALESKGIIQVKSGSGAYVAEDALVIGSVNDAIGRLLNRQDLVLQMLEMRGALECLSASLAAPSISEEILNKLRENLSLQEEILKNSDHQSRIGELARLDADFHTAISRVSGNEIIHEILNALIPSFLEDNKAIFVVEMTPKFLSEHQDILDALAHHNPIEADQSMRKHIYRVIREVREIHRTNHISNQEPDSDVTG